MLKTSLFASALRGVSHTHPPRVSGELGALPYQGWLNKCPPAGVLGVTTAAADFLGPAGIRVCSISPSVVASKMMGDRLVSSLHSRCACLLYLTVQLSPPALLPVRARRSSHLSSTRYRAQ